MKILELFSGYGTATFALKRLGIEHEVVGYSDIDKYANQCFQQNHGGKELGDVKLINPEELPDFDLLTGGFPCQAFSNAGKMQGELEPRGTLFYEIIRIAEVKKPKFMLLENVKGLTCKKFKDTFNKILSELDRIGYNVYWKVLNSKDYGTPQSRARVWFVCFRKDLQIDFKFPEPTELKIFIKDILEQEVDEKYYLSPLLQERFTKYLEDKNRIVNLQPRNGKGQGGKGIISKNDGTTYCLDSGNCQGIVAMVGQLRRLTPKECFRLMGFLNDEINLDGLSDTQRYKLAGNGQDVNVVSLIFKEMFK
jgi:DNA (cytosine-5)-methyltransferase 1